LIKFFFHGKVNENKKIYTTIKARRTVSKQGNFIMDNINMSNPPRFFRSVKTIEDQWNGTIALVFFTPIY